MTAVATSRVVLPPERTIPDLQAILEHAIANDERSLQTALGPSEIGTDCDRCLIRMVAGERGEDGTPWLPTIGTAVHEWAEMALVRHLMTTGTDRYLPEGKVAVGQLRGVDVTGHSDVFDVHTGTVVDYKLVGTTTLRKLKAAKGHPGLTYSRQANLYGRGWASAGFDVRSVAVWFLPRNGFRITDGAVWQEPYDEAVAVEALDRANRFAEWVDLFGVETVLAGAPPHTGTEFSCSRFDIDPKAKAGNQLTGLIPSAPAAHPGAGSTNRRTLAAQK